jgi:hypothetical protein
MLTFQNFPGRIPGPLLQWEGKDRGTGDDRGGDRRRREKMKAGGTMPQLKIMENL